MLTEDGANPKEVMVEMGRSNIAMTYDLYGHLFTDEGADTRRAERAERLERDCTPLGEDTIFTFETMTGRRFPPPWSIEKIPGGLKACDANGQSLAYVYSRENPNDATWPRC